MKWALLAKTYHEGPRDLAGDGLRRRTPNWRSHRKVTGQGSSDPDCTVAFLMEVAFREPRLHEPCGEPTIHARPDGFNGVIGEVRAAG